MYINYLCFSKHFRMTFFLNKSLNEKKKKSKFLNKFLKWIEIIDSVKINLLSCTKFVIIRNRQINE